MNIMIAGAAMDPGPLGVHGGAWLLALGLSTVGLVLLIGALRSAKRAPVYVVRDIGRPF
jgi:hypothetical protein